MTKDPRRRRSLESQACCACSGDSGWLAIISPPVLIAEAPSWDGGKMKLRPKSDGISPGCMTVPSAPLSGRGSAPLLCEDPTEESQPLKKASGWL